MRGLQVYSSLIVVCIHGSGLSTATAAQPSWPTERDGLVFAWRSHDHPDNVIKDSDGATIRTCRLVPKDGAQFGKSGAAILAGNGYFEADEASSKAFAEAWKAAQARIRDDASSSAMVAVEMVITPESVTEGAGGSLFIFERIRWSQFMASTHLHAPYFSPSLSGEMILSANMAGPASAEPHHLKLRYGFGGADVVVNGKPSEFGAETAVFSEREMGGCDSVRQPEKIRIGSPGHEDDAQWKGAIHSIALYVYAKPRTPQDVRTSPRQNRRPPNAEQTDDANGLPAWSFEAPIQTGVSG